MRGDALLDRTPWARRHAAADFGRMQWVPPHAVARPRDAAELQSARAAALALERPVRVRGRGFSVDGQTLTRAGVVLDMSGLDRIRVDARTRTLHAEAGATWRQVVSATLAEGLIPPVVVDFLDLTVGGTLSVGGVSGTSWRFGMQADVVRALLVMTPSGQIVHCSAGVRPRLFEEVLAGAGRHGTIIRATIPLLPAPERVRQVRLHYRRASEFLAAQQYSRPHWAHVDGRVAVGADGTTRYTVDLAHDASTGPRELPGGADEGEEREIALSDFLARADPQIAAQRADGSWFLPHPRVNFILPHAAGSALLCRIAADLSASDLGPAGSILAYPLASSVIRRHRVPKARDLLLLGVQRTAPSRDPEALRRLRAANDSVREQALHAGGVPYAAGAVPGEEKTYCPAGVST